MDNNILLSLLVHHYHAIKPYLRYIDQSLISDDKLKLVLECIRRYDVMTPEISKMLLNEDVPYIDIKAGLKIFTRSLSTHNTIKVLVKYMPIINSDQFDIHELIKDLNKCNIDNIEYGYDVFKDQQSIECLAKPIDITLLPYNNIKVNAGELCVYSALSGIGKSTTLIYLALLASMKYDICFYTLEMPIHRISNIVHKFHNKDKCVHNFIINYFPPNSNPYRIMSHIDMLNFRPQILFVDYADLLSYGMENTYYDRGMVYRALKDIAHRTETVIITASQLNRLAFKESSAQYTVADSVEKYRIADVWINITKPGDNILAYTVDKMRYDKSGASRHYIIDYDKLMFTELIGTTQDNVE